MADILFINACVRAGSRTLELATHVLQSLNGEKKEIDLYRASISPLTAEDIAKRGECSAKGDFSDDMFALAKQFASADTIVIAAPYWDLLFPAVLRTYLEAVSVAGITFRYSEHGAPIGLCRASKLYYVTTAGGFIGENDFGFSYVKALAQKLFGIKDVEAVSAEGLDIAPEKAADILEKAKESFDLSLS